MRSGILPVSVRLVPLHWESLLCSRKKSLLSPPSPLVYRFSFPFFHVRTPNKSELTPSKLLPSSQVRKLTLHSLIPPP